MLRHKNGFVYSVLAFLRSPDCSGRWRRSELDVDVDDVFRERIPLGPWRLIALPTPPHRQRMTMIRSTILYHSLLEMRARPIVHGYIRSTMYRHPSNRFLLALRRKLTAQYAPGDSLRRRLQPVTLCRWAKSVWKTGVGYRIVFLFLSPSSPDVA